jgi:hypothetical protein
MFNMLNTGEKRGNKPPMVCKILDGLCEVSDRVRALPGTCRYLIEGRRLRNGVFGDVGLRIAFLIRGSILMRIRSRKD